MQSKPTIAFWSPMPPIRSGIADYSADVLHLLADRWVVREAR